QFGRELWVSDGTENGTQVVKDISSGNNFSSIINLKVANDKLFFAANATGFGRELWVSDGTENGTQLVKDINPGSNGSEPTHLTAFNDKLFFVADNDQFGRELWVSDGTENGTQLVKDINPGSNGSNFLEFTVFDEKLFFVNLNDQNQYQLWVSDGTSQGTHLIEDIASIEDESRLSLSPNGFYEFTILNNTLFFLAEARNGFQLWKVESENNPPIANDDRLSIFAGESINLTTDLLSNDIDIDTVDTFNIIGVGTPSNGRVSLDSNGDVFFTANKGFSGDASFTYTIADSNNAIDSATVNLTIQ
ncbi:MAG: ELWxxDGT repeat protein, partial [Cyanobacteria bacterium J06635_10]